MTYWCSESRSSGSEDDCRLELLKTKPVAIEDVIKLLFPILVEIDGSSVSSNCCFFKRR